MKASIFLLVPMILPWIYARFLLYNAYLPRRDDGASKAGNADPAGHD